MIKGIILGLLLAIQIALMFILGTALGSDNPLIALPFFGLVGVIALIVFGGEEYNGF